VLIGKFESAISLDLAIFEEKKILGSFTALIIKKHVIFKLHTFVFAKIFDWFFSSKCEVKRSQNIES